MKLIIILVLILCQFQLSIANERSDYWDNTGATITVRQFTSTSDRISDTTRFPTWDGTGLSSAGSITGVSSTSTSGTGTDSDQSLGTTSNSKQSGTGTVSASATSGSFINGDNGFTYYQ